MLTSPQSTPPTKEALDAFLDANVPLAQRPALIGAYWRYMHLIGLVYEGVEPVLGDEDKAAYPHFIKQKDGLPLWVDDDCVSFMHEISRLPESWCRALMERDAIEPIEL